MAPLKGEPEKYKPFMRTDYQNWNYLLGLVSHFFYIPRFLSGWCYFLSTCVILILYSPVYYLVGGYDKRFLRLMRWYAPYKARLACAFSGLVPCVYKVECDYSEWLGPDYEYTYEGAGINI